MLESDAKNIRAAAVALKIASEYLASLTADARSALGVFPSPPGISWPVLMTQLSEARGDLLRQIAEDDS